MLNNGLNGVYTGFAAVVAVLKLRFAKIVALGAAIGDCMVRWSEGPGTALLTHLLAPDLHKWIPSILAYSCKFVAVLVCYQARCDVVQRGRARLRGEIASLVQIRAALFRNLASKGTGQHACSSSRSCVRSPAM